MYKEEPCKTTGAKERESAASEVVQMAEAISFYSEAVVDRVYGKLASVMSESQPVPAVEIDKQREYPPLFSELREKLQVIQAHLRQIEECLSRTEL